MLWCPKGISSQNVFCWPLRIPKTFSKGHWGQNYFIIKEINERHCLLFSLCWYLHWCHKSNGGQNCLCLRKNQGTVLQPCTSIFFFKPVSFKNVLKALKIILLDLNPWMSILTFCATKCETFLLYSYKFRFCFIHIKHFCCLSKYNMLRKNTCETV